MATKRLRIPYVSQLGPGAEYGIGDCGLTCVAQLARAFGHEVTVDEVCRLVNLPRGFTGAHITQHVARAASLLGISLRHHTRTTREQIEAELLANRTVLLLLFYPFLEKKFDPSYDQGHFVTVTGMEGNAFFYDDPFWPYPQGEDIRIEKDKLIAAAWKTGSHFSTPGQALFLRSGSLPDVETPDVTGTGAVVTPPPPPPPPPGSSTLVGVIRDEASQPLSRAVVRLVGAGHLMVDVPGTVLAPVPGAVSWSRTLTGFAGNRWQAWTQFVQEQTSVPFAAFVDEVVTRNPHLAKDGFIFRPEKQYLIPEVAATVSWSRPLSGFHGTRWEAYQAHVRDNVQGISASDFIDQALVHNPHLAAAPQPIYEAEAIYLFPQNIWGGTVVEWTRPLTGFSGHRWSAWETFVKDRVEGITWQEFMEDALEYNPALKAAVQPVFQANQRYLLPQNVVAPLYERCAWTGENGEYQFQGLRAGRYELIVERPGYQSYRERIRVHETVTHDVAMRPLPGGEGPVVIVPPVRTDFIQRSGPNFTLNGQRFRFVGVNLRGLAHYGHPELQTLQASHNADRVVQLDAARQMGARVARLFVANRHINRRETADRLAEALELAGERGIYLIVVFTDVHGDTGFNPAGDERFYTEQGMLNRDWYEGGYRENYLPLIDEIVTRFKEDRRIFAWELGNELKALGGGQVLPEVMIHFTHTVSDHIRSLDPVHLISTGIINSFSLGCSMEQARRLNAHRNVDFLVAHIYDVADPAVFEGFLNLENLRLELLRAEQEANLAWELQKPFIIEEIGFAGGDRVSQTRHHLAKWYDHFGASSVMPWALMATDRDMGDGDVNYGIDFTLRAHRGDYHGLLTAYRERAAVLV